MPHGKKKELRRKQQILKRRSKPRKPKAAKIKVKWLSCLVKLYSLTTPNFLWMMRVQLKTMKRLVTLMRNKRKNKQKQMD